MTIDAGEPSTAVVVVAHPDDETIWTGGMILMHPEWQATVIALCRGSDPDRAPRFRHALQEIGARGTIGDLNDEPGQPPLPDSDVRAMVQSLMPQVAFDVLITHSPLGEYTRHRRHEETGRAVAALWLGGEIRASELWMFAYRDQGRGGINDPPNPIPDAHKKTVLPQPVWEIKYRIITEVYGFPASGYEAAIVQREEAFWCFRSADDFERWARRRSHESIGSV